jgi:alkylation response protein AidB-like acyl-CoA dehydrogenase
MRGRPGRQIARVAVGSAVFAGTAGAVQHRQQKRWAGQEQEAYQQSAQQQQLADQQAQIEALQQQQQYAAPPQQYAAPPPQYAAPPQEQYAPPAEPSYMGELQQLAALRDQGIISAEDFEAKKRQLLGI